MFWTRKKRRDAVTKDGRTCVSRSQRRSSTIIGRIARKTEAHVIVLRCETREYIYRNHHRGGGVRFREKIRRPWKTPGRPAARSQIYRRESSPSARRTRHLSALRGLRSFSVPSLWFASWWRGVRGPSHRRTTRTTRRRRRRRRPRPIRAADSVGFCWFSAGDKQIIF